MGGLIKACISTVSYSVIVNNNVCGFFSPTRGIRQGDPLSPYLFILCMEVLNRALRKALGQKKCRIGFKLSSRAAKIPCLLFTDDGLLFCRTNLESCHELSSVMSNFYRNSGQLINFHKSSLTFSSNATFHDKQIVSSIFNIRIKPILASTLGIQFLRVDQKQKLFLT